MEIMQLTMCVAIEIYILKLVFDKYFLTVKGLLRFTYPSKEKFMLIVKLALN